ncbi:MAG: DinB family protein [Candidatus Solibacter usitatus]|nr:DinB family protein [Candidatus Solibacter usitatus]
MKKIDRKNAYRNLIAMIAVAACLTFPGRGAGQETIDPLAAAVAQRFTMIERSFIGLADAMPAEKYGFKPTDGEFKDVRTFGEQVKHVACSNFGFFNEIEKKEPPARCGAGGPSPAKTKAELMTYLRESFAYAGRVLRTMTPANALEPAGGPYGGMSTRLGLATLAVWHASDHYGQLVVYLRMNGIVPPASQRAPSR